MTVYVVLANVMKSEKKNPGRECNGFTLITRSDRNVINMIDQN